MADKHVLGISGGKDSAALAIYMRQNFPELDIEYFFTDTGKELPEVYEYLVQLEGFLGKPIHRINADRDFDFWLREYKYFLPAPQTRWCTRQLKLAPFKRWVNQWIKSGDTVYSYVAIRADEDYREGFNSKDEKLLVKYPFRENDIHKDDVWDILTASGIGWPKYYKWRSRSGCSFCFFQQKIEWVRLKEVHPELFEEAKMYEKNAIENDSPFTWTDKESLEEIERPERIKKIKDDFEKRMKNKSNKRPQNPLLPINLKPIDIDDVYGDDEGNGACHICHK
ncbi:MAG: phosphoadenosine phosphosulfate reductase family protein [Gammaproteobacteria bacterium]|nr:phosphoadenosine phosphosulfate reductase family protein [Gammaproteobacteria bacterium]